MTLSEKALEIAIQEIGKQEIPKGSNWGPHMQKYLASVGINFPASWCMAFVYWCHQQAADQMGINNPMRKTGGVLAQWNSRKDQYKKNTPNPGDVFIMDFGKGLGHTGIVESVDINNIYTIEGNTNDDGSREGYEVCRRRRPRSKILGYLSFN